MKLKTLALVVTAWVLSPFVKADDHEFVGGIDVNAPFNLQVQMCALLDGVTQEDYDALINDYFKWSKKHDVEVTFIRQVPLFGHATARNPNPYDFVEYLASYHVTSGRGWDKWLTTKDGQKLGERWAKRQATKALRFGHTTEEKSLRELLEVNGVGKGPGYCDQ